MQPVVREVAGREIDGGARGAGLASKVEGVDRLPRERGCFDRKLRPDGGLASLSSSGLLTPGSVGFRCLSDGIHLPLRRRGFADRITYRGRLGILRPIGG